ncbi:hypothetical protein NUU61_004145 [Penicillium alfredii]|uniref:Arginase n=1 Tax=Penicillium alfredii TaxID=1506179 RepID=A0A9W9KDM9_9EURO|nr:uncharacterized protein NUU61_004145 [Penicillium alfredii]KAJ5101923.1 hypothetical protein NUU61_004145 [Penicillium alfredii]
MRNIGHKAFIPRFLTDPAQLAVVAAQFSCVAPRDGAQNGPAALIASGLLDEIQLRSDKTIGQYHLGQTGPRSNHNPDTDPDVDGMKRPRAVSAATQQINERVYHHARQGRFVLTLGGDYSIGIGTVSATAKAVRERHPGLEVAVMWVDAHADINTPQTSLSGRLHGMPKLVYIGLRDVDDAEWQTIVITASRHSPWPTSSVLIRLHRYGIQTIMDWALDHVGPSRIHVSYEIDALDPQCAPSTGFPVASGLSLDESQHIAARLQTTGKVVALDLVGISPQIATASLPLTVGTASSIVK